MKYNPWRIGNCKHVQTCPNMSRHVQTCPQFYLRSPTQWHRDTKSAKTNAKGDRRAIATESQQSDVRPRGDTSGWLTARVGSVGGVSRQGLMSQINGTYGWYGAFHSHGGTPIAGWFISWKNPNLKWMIWGYPHDSGNLHIGDGGTDITLNQSHDDRGPPCQGA